MVGVAIVIALLGLGNAHCMSISNISDNVPGRIVGGQNAVIETYPFQVSVQKNGKHDCGGIILSTKYILTAAHCMSKKSSDVYTVRAGSTYHDQGGSIHRIDEASLNEDTRIAGKVVGDLAILRLVEPLKFDNTRQPVKLFTATDKVKDNQASVVTGWGRIKVNGKFSRQLQTVTMPIVNLKICNEAYKGVIKEGQICAGYYGKGGKDACQGDSGGPMIIDGRLAGVTSWGNGCALPKFPGIYVEVAYYRDWIKKYAGV